jgi:hypothetical protein
MFPMFSYTDMRSCDGSKCAMRKCWNVRPGGRVSIKTIRNVRSYSWRIFKGGK